MAHGARVLVHDDLLATGGTAKALCELAEQLGGVVVGCGFLIELAFLRGRERLKGYDVHALLRDEAE
jgi:adenine phosphoribosyltransferase